MTVLPDDLPVSLRAFPVPVDDNDPRFTFGLIHDVAVLLEAAGYPPINGLDHVDLGQALYRFLYVPRP